MDKNFDEFVSLTDDMAHIIDHAKNINWFANCGNFYNESLYYDYVLSDNIEKTKKNLARANNYAGIITVENLFYEANGRIYSSLKNNEKINVSVQNRTLNSWVLLQDKIIEGFKAYNDFFEIIDQKYYMKFRLDTLKTNFWHLFLFTCVEKYCKSVFPEVPTFFEKVFKIYEDGHIITGWQGKFPSPQLFVDKAIDHKKGSLIIW